MRCGELMVGVSALKNEKEAAFEMEEEEVGGGLQMEEWDFSGSNLLDSIDFDDLFLGGGLPDLEMDPSDINNISLLEEEARVPSVSVDDHQQQYNINSEDVVVSSSLRQRKKNDNDDDDERKTPVMQQQQQPHSKNPAHGKRKVKVDWTPELHRRFVEAVEQLGVDKAVPSRILELMGSLHCTLTRHNIASHLQKYRSHRKHVVVREAEAASWKRRRPHLIPPAPPTMGFPPPQLHVWGHPSLDQSFMPIWPKHLINWPPDPAAAAAPSFWINSHHHHQVPTPGTPCFPPHLPPPPGFSTPPVPGIPPPGLGFPTRGGGGQTLPKPPSDIHPSKECVDAAIGDALSKPWSPLPLGLKPPSVDGVMVELQRQGISKVPPSCA